MTSGWEFVEWLAASAWRASVAGVLLGALVLGIKLCVRRWLPPWWQYALGCLVLARLLCPFSFETRWSVAPSISWAADAAAAVSTAPPARDPERNARAGDILTETSAAPPLAPGLEPEVADDLAVVEIPPSRDLPGASGYHEATSRLTASAVHMRGPDETTTGAGQRKYWTGFRSLALVWFVVCLGLLSHAAVRHVRFSRQVRRWSRALAEWAPLLDECRELAKVRRPVTLLELQGLRSPAVFGFWRPRLLLPAGLATSLTRDELRHIFLHELAHIRCGDVLINWLIITARSAHWFNPLAWIILRQALNDRELVRDTMALRALSRQGGATLTRRAYGHTLVKLATSLSQPALAPGLAPLIRTEKEIHRRITLMKSPMLATFGWRLNLLSAAALATLAIFSFTLATGEEEKPIAPTTPKAESRPATPATLDQPALPPATDRRDSLEREHPMIRKSPDRDGGKADRPETPHDPREAAERARKERLDQMQIRLHEINQELEHLKQRAAAEKDPEVDQELAALREVRSELLKTFYRAKYVPPSVPPAPPVKVPAPRDAADALSVPAPSSVTALPRATAPRARSAASSPPAASSFRPGDPEQLKLERQVNDLKRQLNLLRNKEGEAFLDAARDFGVIDPKVHDVYDRYLKNRDDHEKMLNSGYGQKHPDIQASEKRLEEIGQSFKASLEDQLRAAQRTIEEMRDLRAREDWETNGNRLRRSSTEDREINELRGQLDALRRSIDDMRGELKSAPGRSAPSATPADPFVQPSPSPSRRNPSAIPNHRPSPERAKPDDVTPDGKGNLFREEKEKNAPAPAKEVPTPKEAENKERKVL